MNLTLLTQDKSTTFSHLEWIDINTINGSYIIQKNHAPFYFLLTPQKQITYCDQNGKEETLFLTNGGILNIDHNNISLLLFPSP